MEKGKIVSIFPSFLSAELPKQHLNAVSYEFHIVYYYSAFIIVGLMCLEDKR